MGFRFANQSGNSFQWEGFFENLISSVPRCKIPMHMFFFLFLFKLVRLLMNTWRNEPPETLLIEYHADQSPFFTFFQRHIRFLVLFRLTHSPSSPRFLKTRTENIAAILQKVYMSNRVKNHIVSLWRLFAPSSLRFQMSLSFSKQ